MARRRWLVAAAVGLTIAGVAGAASTPVLAKAFEHKTDVCHVAGNKYVKLSIADSALDAHLHHGDVMPDEYGTCP